MHDDDRDTQDQNTQGHSDGDGNSGDLAPGSRSTAGPAGAMSAVFAEQPSDEEIEEIEAERQRRLAPENRPPNAEVDNTGANMPDFVKQESSE